MRVEKLILEAINEYDMIAPGASVLVGFSGGADSVCLLSVLYEQGYNVTAAHVNHNMRDTAARDMEFCRQFCTVRNIPIEIKTVPPGELKGEDSARRARYEFFYDVMRRRGIDRLATAHNKNDSAETVLLHLLRGASTDGLCGIAPKEGKLVRPLLFVKKAEVFEYCKSKGLEYVTDETNLTDVYARNKLRNSIMPVLEKEFNPALADSLADNALITARDADYLRQCAEQEFERLYSGRGIDINGLLAMHPAMAARTVQLLWKKAVCNAQNLPHGYINDILSLAGRKKSGSGIDLPGGCRANVSYGCLTIDKKKSQQSFCYPLETGKWCVIPQSGIRLIISEEGTGGAISLDGGEVLSVRSWQGGDSFTPAGMKGRKKLSDYFTDKKIPKQERITIPIICADGKIASVAQMRASADFAPGKRAKIYHINIERL